MAESRGECDTAARTVSDDGLPRFVCGSNSSCPARQTGVDDRRRHERVRSMELAGVSRAGGREHHYRHPLRDARVQARNIVGRRVARYTARGHHDGCLLCADSVLRRIHDERAVEGSERPAGMDRIPFRLPRSATGARRACPAAGPASVLLEEREVGARHHAAGSRRNWVLGALCDHNYGDPWREQRYSGD